MSAALTSIHSDSVDAGDFGVLVHGGAGFVPEALVPVRTWLDEQRAIWESRLDRFDDYVATLMKDRSE